MSRHVVPVMIVLYFTHLDFTKIKNKRTKLNKSISSALTSY
jgi:hypothetical protein